MLNSRKLLSLLLALMLLLSLAACSGGNSEQQPDNNNSDNGNSPDQNGTLPDQDDDTSGEETEDSRTDTGSDTENTDKPDDSASGDESVNDENKPSDSAVDLSAFYDTLEANYELSATTDMDETLTDAYLPGLSDIPLRQSVLKTPLISSAVSEFLLVECENSEDAAAVKEIFQSRMQTQIDGGAWYPASIDTWRDAQIVTSGNYVAMFAHSDAEDMAQDFSALFTE